MHYFLPRLTIQLVKGLIIPIANFGIQAKITIAGRAHKNRSDHE
jgi:hypothetical protein